MLTTRKNTKITVSEEEIKFPQADIDVHPRGETTEAGITEYSPLNPSEY